MAVPTETVYGLAADALNPRACRKIFTAKGRPTSDPLIVHVHSLDQVAAIAKWNRSAMRLAKRFWPGPLTIVLPKKPVVPDIISAGLTSVAVRMPSHPLFRRLLKLADTPLAAPSANRFGYISPTTARHVHDGLAWKIRHILDGGPSKIGLESTIVDLRRESRPRLLRPGAITQAEVERVLGRKLIRPSPRSKRAKQHVAQVAPGLLTRHYSPRTPIELHQKIVVPRKGSTREAWVLASRPTERKEANVFWLDAGGDLRAAARRLFSVLRGLDDGRFKKIHVEIARGGGIADAINDRLRRAAAR